MTIDRFVSPVFATELSIIHIDQFFQSKSIFFCKKSAKISREVFCSKKALKNRHSAVFQSLEPYGF